MSGTPDSGTAGGKRRVREDGARSRRAILDEATKLTTVEGLEGLSIARLAEKVGISKSGLFAHFGSKEDLQLATVETAWGIYQREVVEPALREENPMGRLRALCEGFLSLVGDDLFPGGCFFSCATAEFSARPGPVRDRLVVLVHGWMRTLSDLVDAARTAGLLSETVEPEQAAFDLNAYLHLANDLYVLHRDRAHLERARHSISVYLARAASDSGSTVPLRRETAGASTRGGDA